MDARFSGELFNKTKTEKRVENINMFYNAVQDPDIHDDNDNSPGPRRSLSLVNIINSHRK